MSVPTYGSLFAGVGGFDMGFDRAGYECRFQVEWDRHCQSVLARHWPDTPRWADVNDVDGAQLPPADVIIFGSPCQDLSVAGKREGLAGARSGLFHQAMRIIKEMRHATANTYPRVIVWENVVGALSSNGGADFGTVLDEMAEAGSLVIEWAVLDAQYFGVAQRRRRVFVVAILDPDAVAHCPDPLLPVSESVRRDLAPSDPSRQDPATTTARRTDSDGQWAAGSTDTGILRQSISSKWSKGSSGPSGDEYINMVVEPYVKGRRARSVDDHETWVPGNVTPTLNVNDTGDVRATTVVAYSVREDATAGIFSATPLDRANSLSALRPSVQSHHAQAFIVDQQTHGTVRRLTPVECERLMGWPDDHTRWTADGKEQSDTQRFRQIGNGVATPVAQWIAGHLLPVLQPTLVDCTNAEQKQKQR